MFQFTEYADKILEISSNLITFEEKYAMQFQKGETFPVTALMKTKGNILTTLRELWNS